MNLEYSFKKIRLPFLGFFCLLLFGALARAQISENEKKVLIEFYETTNGTEWTNSWNLTESVNTWKGVTVVDGKVTQINLFQNNLQGGIPESIGKIGRVDPFEFGIQFVDWAFTQRFS